MIYLSEVVILVISYHTAAMITNDFIPLKPINYDFNYPTG
jgi:hypothetical protein